MMMRAMELQAIRYEVDGKSFTGYLADGSGGRRVPGVLVAHEGAGLVEHPKQRTRRLAELGYVAFAMDIFGGTDLPLEEAKAIVRELRADRAMLRRRAHAALDVLVAHPGVDAQQLAAIGFCFGGTAVLELVRDAADVRCVVGFHAGLDAPPSSDANKFQGKLLVCLGEQDPVVTAEHRDTFVTEMAAGGVDWQMIVYGGAAHSFTNPDIDAYGYPGFAYDAVADRRSWLAMRNLFDETLGPVTGAP